MSGNNLTRGTNQQWRWLVFALVVILCLAGYLRFYGITQRGLIDHDEAAYLLEAKSITAGLQIMAGYQPVDQVSIGTAHPGHTFLIWLATLVIGIHDYTGMLLSVVLGILSVGIVFFLGKEMFDTETGLIAAAVLSVSGYHLIYSRSGAAEATLTFFYLIGTFFYYMSRKDQVFRSWPLFLSGFCAGYAFTVHYRSAIVFAIFAMYELQMYFFEKQPGLRTKLKRGVLLVSGALVPALVFEMPYQVVTLLRGRSFNELQTYFEQLIYRYDTAHGSFSLRSLPANMAEYTRYLWEIEHPLVTLLLLVGVIIIFINLTRKFTLENFVLFSGFMVPFVFFSFYRNIDFALLRSPAIAIPFAALVVGRTITCISRYATQNYRSLSPSGSAILMGIVTIIIMSVGLVYDSKLIKVTSGYREAVRQSMDYLLKTGKTMSVDPAPYPIWRYYAEETLSSRGLSVNRSHLMRFTPKQWDNFLILSSNLRAGYHYYPGGKSLGLIRFVETPSFEIDRIIRDCSPVVRVSHPADKFLPFFYEGVPRQLAKKAIEQPYAGYIQVFDLETCGKIQQ